MIDPSVILFILVSFMRMIDTSSSRRHIFCSDASRYNLVAQSVGPIIEEPDAGKLARPVLKPSGGGDPFA